MESIEDPEVIIDAKFADYVFFPFGTLLQKPALGDRATVYLEKVMGFLIQYGWSINIDPSLAKQFFILLSYLISSPGYQPQAGNTNNTSKRSDESRAAGCYALKQLFKAIQNTQSVASKFASDTSIIPTIGNTVSTFLDCILTGVNSLDLQTQSLDALYDLLFGVVKDGEPLATMLPAVISTLTKVLAPQHGSKRHYAVYVAIFKVLQKLLEIVFNDKELGLEEKAAPTSVLELSKQIQNGSEKKPQASEKKKIRSKQWIKASKEQVRVALSAIPTFRLNNQTQQRPEVQSALIYFSFGVIKHSSVSLDNCLSLMFDNIMLAISQDPNDSIDPTIPQEAKTQLEEILVQEYTKVGTQGRLIQVLQERIFDWIDSFPRLLSSHNDTQSKRIIDSIKCGILILSNVQGFSSSILGESEGLTDSGFKFLFDKLISLVQDSVVMSPSEKLLPQIWPNDAELTQKLITHDNSISQNTHTELAFSEFGIDVTMSSDVQQKLSDLVTTLGKYSPSTQTIRQLLGQINDQNQSLPQAALASWLAVNSFEGMVLEQSAEKEVDDWLMDLDSSDAIDGYRNTITQASKEDLVIEMYTFSINQLASATSSFSSPSLASKPGFGRFQDLLTANALRGLSLVSKYMGKDFRHQLMDVLYPLIDLLGSTSTGGSSILGSSPGAIRLAAQQTLISIAHNCGYENVRHMVVSNYDYVIDSFSLRLNTLDFSPQGPLSLSTIVTVSGPQILPYLNDIVDSLFTILDNYHGYKSIVAGIFAALQSIVQETKRGYSEDLKLLMLTDGPEIKMITEGRMKPNVNLNRSTEANSIKSSFSHVESFDGLLEMLDRGTVAPDLEMKEQFERDVAKEEEDDDEKHPNKPFADIMKDTEDVKEPEGDEPDEPDETQDGKSGEDGQKWLSPIPKPTWDLVKQIVEYSDRFLLHESGTLRRQLLELMEAALPILATASNESLRYINSTQAAATDKQDKSEIQTQEHFLPIINNIWPVLVHTLDDPVPEVSRRALETIVQVIQLAGGFMSTRIVDLWPRIKSILVQSSFQSTFKSTFKSYSNRGPHPDQNRQRLNALEIHALTFVTASVANTRLDTVTFSDMLATVGPYVDLATSRQQSSGQDVEELQKALSSVNQDAVWFQVVKLNQNQNLWPVLPDSTDSTDSTGFKFRHLDEFVPFSLS